MGTKKAFSQHIIYGIQPNKFINKYAFNTPESVSNISTIWQFKRNFKQFKIYLDLIGKPRNLVDKHPEATLLNNLFQDLENHRVPKSIMLQQVAIGLLQLGSGQYLKKMQAHLRYFEQALTPQYRQIMGRIDFSIAPRDELIFHTCNPDIYLWIPSATNAREKLIILYPTRSNTYNMPRHLAHFLLAKRGIALMYIGNRPNLSIDDTLISHSNQESADLILKIAHEYGFSDLYGVGTSYGGFKICQLAEKLHLKKVLNFSGAQKEPTSKDKTTFMRISSDYPLNKILSVLSKSDEVDQGILKAYNEEGFITERAFLNSKSHGSFSSSFLEGKLDGYLDWLLD